MEFVQDIADFRNWWVEELKAMLPRVVLTRLVRHQRPSWTISILGREAVRIATSSGTDDFQTAPHLLAETLEELLRTVPQRKLGVELILEPGRFLERQLAPFRLPKRRACNMATLDVQSSTPLDPADVLILFASNDRNWPGHRYFVVKKSVLVPILAAIEGLSGTVVAIRVRAEDELIELEPNSFVLLGMRRRGSLGDFLVKTGMLACCLGVVATFAHVHWRYAQGLSQLDIMTHALEADVKTVRLLSEQRRHAVEQIENVRQQKRQTTPLVRIWEELTRVIADDTWISDLSVDGDKVTFSGMSRSAAGLIADLEESAMFRSPTFSGPVSRAPGTDSERFKIDMRLEL